MQSTGGTQAETGRTDRPVIVHCHMFKNAGSTLDWSLKRGFGEQMRHLWGDLDGKTEIEQLEMLLRAGDDLRAVTGHKLRPPLPEIAGIKLLPIFILRNPIERAYSVYCFERGQILVTPGSTRAKQLSFREYIRWRMDPACPLALRDFQTRFCAGRGYGRDVPPSLEQAMQTLQATPLVATADLYDPCMVLFEMELRPYFPGMDLAYVRQNVGKYRAASPGSGSRIRPLMRFLEGIEVLPGGDGVSQVDSRVNRILEMLGPEVGDLLVERNQKDLKLYAGATSLVNARLQLLENPDHSLAGFRQRCETLTAEQTGSRVRAAADFMTYLFRLTRARMQGLSR